MLTLVLDPIRATRLKASIARFMVPVFCTFIFFACEETKQDTHSEVKINQVLPEDVIGFGGSDDLQQWLFRVQSYVQGAQPSTPPFALMLPSLVATGIGLTLPQILDLSAPARWLIATPKEGDGKKRQAIQHSPYLTIPEQEIPSAWRGVACLKLRSGIQVEGVKEALNTSMWDVDGKLEQGEMLHAQMTVASGGMDEGHLIIKEGWLFVGNDLKLLRSTMPVLLKELQQPLSKEFFLSARIAPLERYLNRVHPEKLSRLKGHPDLWSTLYAELATLELKVSAEALELILSSSHQGSAPLSPYCIDGKEALKRLPRSTGGFVITSSELPAFKSLLQSYQNELPKVLTLLRPPPKLGLTFALNEQLELSALITGGGTERDAWLSGFLKAVQVSLDLNQKQQETNQFSSGPLNARNAVLVEDQPLNESKVEALKLFNLPQLDLGETKSALSQINVQLSETRLWHAPDASYVTFGPKSRAYLELWQQLGSGGQLGIVDRADLKRFKGNFSDLLFMLYLAPPSVDRALGKSAQGKPQDPQGREGISLVAKASQRRTSLALTIPVGVAERFVAYMKEGRLPLNLSGKNP